jgi:hypothetical protein
VNLMKVLAVAVAAIVLSVLTVLGGAALRAGAWPTGADATGFAMATAVAGALLVGALYWPVLAGLRRRAVALPPWRAALVTALGLNAPAYAALAVLGQDRRLFAGGEAPLIALGFASMGLAFGAGYARVQRGAAA